MFFLVMARSCPFGKKGIIATAIAAPKNPPITPFAAIIIGCIIYIAGARVVRPANASKTFCMSL